MSGIEFAVAHAGRKFKIPPECLPEKAAVRYGDYHIRGRLVGYMKLNPDLVVVELEDGREECWPLTSGGVELVVPQTGKHFADPQFPLVLAVPYKKLTPPMTLEELKAQQNQQPKPVVVPPAYPKLCKACNKPARVYGKRVMCSNKACDTRQEVLGSLAIKRHKVKPIRCPLKSRGKVCDGFAVYFSDNGGDFFLMDCEKGHTFERYKNELRVDDLVMMTKVGNDYNDRVWNGKSWEVY